MRTLAVVTTALCLMIFPAFGQSAKQCSEIPDNDERLKCYDALFQVSSQDTTPDGETGDWRVRTETSPIDDSQRVFLSLSGREGIRDQYGRNAQISLTIACRENTTSLWFHFGGQFMSDTGGAGRVTYRIDTATAQHKNFIESSNHEALGLWNGGASIPFLKSLFGAEQLFLQATPYSESAVNDFFDIGGLEVAIQPLRTACSW